jgi:fluoride exporter
VNVPLAIAVVAFGGAFGSVLRYLVSNWFLEKVGSGFPWGTFTINVSGAFVIGVVLELAGTRPGFSPYVRLLWATGILGGYTTFSTFAYETYVLSAQTFSILSVVYAGGSVVAGVIATIAGVGIVRAVLH